MVNQTTGFTVTIPLDRQIETDDLLEKIPDVITAFHFGSLALANAKDAKIWLELVLALKQHDTFIALDPNVRLSLIENMETYKASLNAAFSLCDVLKFSEEDVRLLYPAENPIDILQDLQQTHHIPLGLPTMGGKGSFARTLEGSDKSSAGATLEQSWG